MLLQSAKELFICGDFGPEDVFFYYTTTGWYAYYYIIRLALLIGFGRMMWNFLISALPIGLTIVLFDGSPLENVSLLFNFVDNLKISIFGTRLFRVFGHLFTCT
jgi:acetoacetyl-CoA synthetase